MPASSRWVTFITKLNRQTQAGKIKWKATNEQPDLLNSDFVQYGTIYVANLETDIRDATARIYREKRRLENEYEEEYWTDRVILDIRTSELEDFIRIPSKAGLDDLYETVAYSSSRVDDFVDTFLKSSG